MTCIFPLERSIHLYEYATMNTALLSATNLAPVDKEIDFGPLPLEGVISPDLRGTLVRNGPNPVDAATASHWFFGDGMLHAFHIENGEVHYRNRWVRTTRYRKAARLDVAPDEADSGTANTNVIRHAGKTLALEEAHLPVAVTLPSLETVGTEDFGGQLRHRFTAHPKADARGELVFFAYGVPDGLSAGMAVGALSAEGELITCEPFTAPYASMVHDFAITGEYALIPVMPLTGSRERLMAGGPAFAWEPERGSWLAVIPRRDGVKAMRWLRAPLGYLFHVMNAWQDDRALWLDVMQYDAPPLFTLPDGTPASEPDAHSRLVRWQIPLHGDDEIRQQVLFDAGGDFPRIDERFTGKLYRHGWFVTVCQENGALPDRFNTLAHIDHLHGQVTTWQWPEAVSVSEPVFVADGPQAEEGTGTLLMTVWTAASNTSALVAFNALNIEQGPLWRAALPVRVPDGFHGNWFADEEDK